MLVDEGNHGLRACAQHLPNGYRRYGRAGDAVNLPGIGLRAVLHRFDSVKQRLAAGVNAHVQGRKIGEELGRFRDLVSKSRGLLALEDRHAR